VRSSNHFGTAVYTGCFALILQLPDSQHKCNHPFVIFSIWYGYHFGLKRKTVHRTLGPFRPKPKPRTTKHKTPPPYYWYGGVYLCLLRHLAGTKIKQLAAGQANKLGFVCSSASFCGAGQSRVNSLRSLAPLALDLLPIRP